MGPSRVVYTVNGVVSNIWRRLAGSKTFWIVAIFVLAAAERWSKGLLTGGQFLQIVQTGVIGILLRTALSKAEMASNALNPDIKHIEATTKPAGSPGLPLSLFLGLFLCICGLPTLIGCESARQAQLYDAAGNPIEMPKSVGIQIPLGSIFGPPEPEPTPPPPIAIAQPLFPPPPPAPPPPILPAFEQTKEK